MAASAATTAGKVHITFVYVLLFIVFFFATLYHHYLHPANYSFSLSSFNAATAVSPYQHLHHHHLPSPPLLNTAIAETTPLFNASITTTITQFDHVNVNVNVSAIPATISILLPAWEVLVIVSPDDTLSLAGKYGVSQYFCFYPNNDVSAAKPAGMLTSPNRATFKCLLPRRSRRQFPFFQPILTLNPKNPPQRNSSATPELLRWTYVVYDSITTDDDVVVFAKGLNPRQGLNREPSELNCLFYYNDDMTSGVKTTVTSSMQEVFRCKRPELTTSERGGEDDQIKVTLSTQDQVVPTLAYYSPIRKLAKENGKSLLCACTMVYNVAKFLKEWVVYHSSIGVEKFILYNNESDDNLEQTVKDLNKQGYDITVYFWIWPKAQEAGFSHSVVYAKDSCTWMAYIDVDEFIFSPSWLSSSTPSKSMLQSLISYDDKNREFGRSERSLLGQINIGCYEFGPSNQMENPVTGVTQGYDCRRKHENRHKSIVLIEAIDDSLLTVIHHFSLKKMYKSKKIGIHSMTVNHYKYQAWPEFKAKFRRRVSAYVVDWTDQVNIRSKDRTPGLGFAPVEPPGWPEKFCEVHDYRLKELTGKWFCKHSPTGCKMVWQC